ncbi:SUF system NifU family Fe-S cluster assembly protein [Aquabacterium sp. A7-Y]|uniref:Fe-S cluster assembly sulfur transfer protein SufU n=1 Tax=Aquabacterium sp. A7-Y TaxID=1349605 RepID=UPI00223DBC01|nr:SUF system NifU family Fe-S cluster assembly protein [Aquabacterium sp. A7-Y]MCW7541000.1 SUF system NifU family Fe-S cluster assembly protein [Aquabacterium sp. A7-Y]
MALLIMSMPFDSQAGDGNETVILYRGEIARYGRQPHNLEVLEGATVEVNGDSPICGDHMSLYLDLSRGEVRRASFMTSACCAVCKASASMMTDALTGKSIDDVHLLKQAFHQMIENGEAPVLDRKRLGQLTVFERLRDVPSRVECALLPWTTLEAALNSLTLSASLNATVVPVASK